MNVDTPYVFLYETNDSLVLNLVRSRLTEEGIDFRIFGQETSGIYPIPSFEARILVHDDDFAEAKLLLDRIKESLGTRNNDYGYRDSTLEDIEYEKEVTENEGKHENPMLGTIIMILIFALLIYLFVTMAL